MKQIWLIAGALALSGCSSTPDPAPETTAIAPSTNVVQPQIVATAAPPVVEAPILPPPQSSDSNSLSSQSVPQTTNDEQPQQSAELKRQQVASLRLEIGEYQNQRRAVEELKRQFQSEHPKADPNQLATGSNFPDDATMANYNQRIQTIDSEIDADQRRIDDLMMSR